MLNEEKYKQRIIKNGIKAARKLEKSSGKKIDTSDIPNLVVQTSSFASRAVLIGIGSLILFCAIYFYHDMAVWIAVALMALGLIVAVFGAVGRRRKISKTVDVLDGIYTGVEVLGTVVEAIIEVVEI